MEGFNGTKRALLASNIRAKHTRRKHTLTKNKPTHTHAQSDAPSAPCARYLHVSVSTEEGMIVWGGTNEKFSVDNGLYCFTFGNARWSKLTVIGKKPAGESWRREFEMSV
jgi:hypothetical protein